jgi:phosphoenolpyruvate carboxykinase (ATP)
MVAPPIEPLVTLAPANGSAATLDLRIPGLINTGVVRTSLSRAELTELAVRRNEGILTEMGALVARTYDRTGRSPKDRYVVVDPQNEHEIWWGPSNHKIQPAVFNRLLDKVLAYLQGRDLFVTDSWACADPRHRLAVRVIAEKAWHALFADCLLIRPRHEDPDVAAPEFQPQLTILNACGLRADPATDGTRSDVFILLNLERRLVVIGGTHYAGEIKKSVFGVLNYLLPKQGVFPMHCSANIGAKGDTALFFGLSGTGKTTLSADPDRHLIGDDEHAWTDEGVFNIEGGCYAKTIRLSREGEPQIWNALRFGCVLENVVVDPRTRRPNFDDDHYTENTRAAYPVEFIDNYEPSGRGGHPANVLFLTCDAFGVLPPVSRLTADQALYHFLSGYTAKVAGTEAGITEPQITFSTCFAAPFLPLYPNRYAELLREKLAKHHSQVWLVNTGWTGGPYGRGARMKLAYTRAMVRAALSGELAKAKFTPDPVFGVLVPESCPGVSAQILKPRNTWPSADEYDTQARQLAARFQANFATHAPHVSEPVRQAGPRA